MDSDRIFDLKYDYRIDLKYHISDSYRKGLVVYLVLFWDKS